MQILQNGIEVPTNSDTYKLTEDLANMGNKSNVVIPAPSKDFRDALADKYPAMTVARTDLPQCPLETYDGTNWSVSDVPWTTLNPVQGFESVTDSGWSGVKYAVKNGWVIVNGAVKRSTPWAAGSVHVVIPAAYRPAYLIQGTNNSQCEPTAGNIGTGAGSGAVSFSLTWPLF